MKEVDYSVSIRERKGKLWLVINCPEVKGVKHWLPLEELSAWISRTLQEMMNEMNREQQQYIREEKLHVRE